MSKMAEIAYDMDRIGIGHNQPPGVIDAARDTMEALADWMKEHPVIANEDDAREAKKLLDRAKGSAGEIEHERVRLTKPLNDQIEAINAKHKGVHNTDKKKPGVLDLVMIELKDRLTEFIKAEEDRRAAEAEQRRLEAEEAARIAAAADAAKQEAIENAKAGELGVDVTQVVIDAKAKADAFGKADRALARADRDAHVKIGGGWGKSVSLRTAETLVLVSYGRAIKAIGPNETIRDAILTAAREYRRQNGQLPDGVEAEHTRKL